MTDPRWLDGSRDPVAAELRRALDEARERPSDDVALRRIWGKVAYVEAEVRQPRWFWFAGGIACSAVLTALVVMLWPRSTGIDQRSQVSAVAAAPVLEGPADVPPDQADAAPGEAPDDDLSPAPRLVRTAASETMRLALRGGVEARVGARSVLNLGGAGKERPSVERGDVGFKVPRQAPGKTFSVDVGPYRIVVVGTTFRLGHHGRRVVVDVDEGVVEIWRGRRLARLTAGESWTGPLRVPQAPPPAFGTPAAPAVETPTPWPALISSSAGPPAPSSGPSDRPTPATPGIAPAQQAPAPSESPADAHAALAAGDFHRALELYRGIKARGGPAAENAEYEIGMILRDRLKRPNKAIAAWRRYRAEHPDGLLRAEADVSIIETLVRSGDTEAALAEAQEFLLRHPGSERRAEIASVAGDLYRNAGECRRAVNAYDVTLTSPRAQKLADSATFYRAVCLTALNQDEGRAGLRVYLRDFANGRHREQAVRLLQGSDRGAP